MKKRFIISWCILFVLFLIAPHFLNIFNDQSDAQNSEKRDMAEFPELSFATIEDFPSDFETYYNDALPFRSNLIQINSLMNYTLFKESSVSKVLIGKENWLFYNPNGTDGDTIGDISGETLFSDEELEIILQTLVAIDAELTAQGKEFVVMITPNKESIMREYLPDGYYYDNTSTADQVVEYLQSNSNLRIVYPKDALITAKNDYPQHDFFYKTDTHWNYLGGYVGASCLAEELGYHMEPILNGEVVNNLQTPCDKDLATMMGLRNYIDEESNHIIDYKANSNILSSSKDFVTKYCFTTDSTNDKKLLVIRDSFCTAMAEHTATNFKESVMIHRDYYNPTMLQEENPDIVVFQIVERLLYKIPDFKMY